MWSAAEGLLVIGAKASGRVAAVVATVMGKRITAPQPAAVAATSSAPAVTDSSSSSSSSGAAQEEASSAAVPALAASAPSSSSRPSARAQYLSMVRAFSPSLQDGVKRGEAAALSAFSALFLSLSALNERPDLPAELEVAVDALYGSVDTLRRAVVQLKGEALSTSDELQRRRDDAAQKVRDVQREEEEQRHRAAQQERESRQRAAHRPRLTLSKKRKAMATTAQKRRRQEKEREQKEEAEAAQVDSAEEAEAEAMEAPASPPAVKRPRLSVVDPPPLSVSSSRRFYSVARRGSKKAAVSTPPSASRSAALRTPARAVRPPHSTAAARSLLPAAEALKAAMRREEKTGSRAGGRSGRSTADSKRSISRLTKGMETEVQAGRGRKERAEAEVGSSVFDF